MRRPGEAGAAPSSEGSGVDRPSPPPTPAGPSVSAPLSEQPTLARPQAARSPAPRGVGRDAFRRYEASLSRLRPRDQRAIRGRIERQQTYATLAESLGVANAETARAVVTRALGRLVGDDLVRRDPACLDGLIASVADGWPQDWDAIGSLARDERTRRAVSSLRTVAAIAEAHRHPTPRARAGRAERPPAAPWATGGESAGHKAPATLGQWGRFLLLRKLGEGGFGDVYQAHDTQLDRDVALKLLRGGRSSADPGRRLLREARLLARVRHPNVASVYGAGEHDGRAGLWMELVRGVNLEQLLQSRGPMSACEAALVGIDVCRALGAVHAAGLVHRDVKASNIMREEGGRILLADFGAGSGPGLRPRRQCAGTPLYLAPEVLAGEEATVRSDIYGLGVVLFRMVTASYPRMAVRACDLLESRDAGVPTSMRDLRPDLPDAFVTAVEMALAPHPADRPQTAGAFRSALGLVLGVPTSWRRACRAPRPSQESAGTASLAPLGTTRACRPQA